MNITLEILGSGTSTGIPMLACQCRTCTSADPRDQRFRASALIRWGSESVVIDTTPEFRLQMLRADVRQLSAVLLTHNHADHIHGFDDLRAYAFAGSGPVPIYGSPETIEWVRNHFSYIWDAKQAGGGLPQVELRPVVTEFEFRGLRIVPVPLKHGILDVYGYRVGNLAYLSDLSELPAVSLPLLRGVEILVVDAVRYRPHSTHLHLQAAIDLARQLKVTQTVFTHLNHDFLHAVLEAELPPGMMPAFDGLKITGTA